MARYPLARHTDTGKPRCIAVIHDNDTGGTKQCSNAARYCLPTSPETVRTCGTHARSYDRPMTRAEITEATR